MYNKIYMLMKNASEREYPKMVVLNYSNFHFEVTEHEQKLLKLYILRTLQKIKISVSNLKEGRLRMKTA